MSVVPVCGWGTPPEISISFSTFLPCQPASPDLYFTPVLWPDFDREHLYEAIRDFQKRTRRFGAIDEPRD